MKVPRAFTLIETLVAISVLLLALTGPLTIAANALNSAYYARDQVIASYLAQEGLEYVRAKRDENRIASPQQAWLAGGLSNCLNAQCTVDFANFTAPAICSSVCSPLKIAESGNIYNQASGANSRFTRVLTLTSVSATEVRAVVTVSWDLHGTKRTVTITENFFQWI